VWDVKKRTLVHHEELSNPVSTMTVNSRNVNCRIDPHPVKVRRGLTPRTLLSILKLLSHFLKNKILGWALGQRQMIHPIT
jgi:hypothetical protein